MKNVDPHTRLEVIDRAECLRLLANDVVGRLAIVEGGAPLIFPINYVLDGEAVVFRSAGGTKVNAARRASAAFEIDGLDRDRRCGWSVVASGPLEEVTKFDAGTLERLRQLPVDPWADGAKDHWMRLRLDRVSGRRVGGPS